MGQSLGVFRLLSVPLSLFFGSERLYESLDP